MLNVFALEDVVLFLRRSSRQLTGQPLPNTNSKQQSNICVPGGGGTRLGISNLLSFLSPFAP